MAPFYIGPNMLNAIISVLYMYYLGDKMHWYLGWDIAFTNG